MIQIRKYYHNGKLTAALKKMKEYRLEKSQAPFKKKIEKLRSFYRKASKTQCTQRMRMIHAATQEYQEHSLIQDLKEQCQYQLPPQVMQ